MSGNEHYFKNLLDGTLSDWGWEHKVSLEQNDRYIIKLTYEVDELSGYQFYIEGHIDVDWLRFYLYSPITVPSKRHKVACEVLNHVNGTLQIGSLQILSGTVRYRHTVDTKGFTVPIQMVSSMREIMMDAFRPKVAEAIGALAFSNMSAKEIIVQFEASDINTSIPLNREGTNYGLYLGIPKS
jgi:hypothetical protein